jgi:hypothetical protein
MSRAKKRAERIVGPPPKKQRLGDRIRRGTFDQRDKERAYRLKLEAYTKQGKRMSRHQIRKEEKMESRKKAAKSGCLSAILLPIILASRLLPGLPELKLPEAPAETTDLAQIISEAGSLTVAASTAETVVDLEP